MESPFFRDAVKFWIFKEFIMPLIVVALIVAVIAIATFWEKCFK